MHAPNPALPHRLVPLQIQAIVFEWATVSVGLVRLKARKGLFLSGIGWRASGMTHKAFLVDQFCWEVVCEVLWIVISKSRELPY